VTPLPPLDRGGAPVVGWRLDLRVHASNWDSGEGAFRVGGRWNNPGVRAVYASLDPATAIMEVAVHKGFVPLDTVPHTLTSFAIADPSDIHVVWPADVPNPNWLHPVTPNAGQRAFGDALLAAHRFVLIPSAVSIHSWNLIFVAKAVGAYAMARQAPFALDPRLNPAP
jgi:RES domain-containing protein